MDVSIPPFVWDQVAAEDARTIVPVVDQHGGLMIYRQGRPAFYCLNGEWFEAVSVTGPADLGIGDPAAAGSRPDLEAPVDQTSVVPRLQ